MIWGCFAVSGLGLISVVEGNIIPKFIRKSQGCCLQAEAQKKLGYAEE